MGRHTRNPATRTLNRPDETNIVTRGCRLRRALIDTTKERYDVWLLNEYGLPSVCRHQLLRGGG